jgi:hypothetical protein
MPNIENYLDDMAEGAVGLASYDEAFDLFAEARAEFKRRGSRARYRRLVKERLDFYTRRAVDHRSVAEKYASMPWVFDQQLAEAHAAIVPRYQRAATRCLRILAGLDGAG